TLARILRFAGDDVTMEYYVNDVGKQVAILVWGTDNAPDDLPPPEREKEDHVRVRAYRWANERMEEDPEVAAEIDALIERVETGDRPVVERFGKVIGPVLEGMLESLARLNIAYDSFVNESEFILDGSVERVIEGLKRSPLAVVEEDGAWYLDMEGMVHGRTARFVFARASGTSLYTTRDIAYHMDKFRRGDHLINVLGEDHRLQARQLALALHELGEEREPENIFYSFVSLPEGKMSTRRGRVVYMDDLLDEAVERATAEVEARRPELPEERRREIAEAVGIGAVRYNIVRVQAEKKIVFRWEEALNFDGDSAPFLQYAYARASSILRNAGAAGHVFEFAPDPDDQRLLEVLAAFPSTVRSCAEERRPHRMASYLHTVAVAFNHFYRDCRVIGSDRERERLALVSAARTVLGNGLDLLGIAHPEEI
ncbi:MAG TPA: arginine--tRNA ligase, partial [Thermoplasmata archaeon]|nr:arginine--tRNA ligase [Thermoplasmata archaeon]